MTAPRPRSRSSRALVLAGGLLGILTASIRVADSGVDCRAAQAASIDALVCGSSLLSALDAETARLEGLASRSAAGPIAAPGEGDQRGLPPRDMCLQAPAPERCALDWYLARIASLRAVSEAARSDDDRGISRGPVGWQCDGGAGPIATVFVNSDPAFLMVGSPRGSLTMWRARAASGAKYDGPDGALFWEHQGQARFHQPGATAEVTCAPDRSNP